MQFHFDDHFLDTIGRELRRGSELVAVEPQVLDLLIYLVGTSNNDDFFVGLIAGATGR
jgi:DNA-binding winged helix-turn-helix (wHTH) protein